MSQISIAKVAKSLLLNEPQVELIREYIQNKINEYFIKGEKINTYELTWQVGEILKDINQTSKNCYSIVLNTIDDYGVIEFEISIGG